MPGDGKHMNSPLRDAASGLWCVRGLLISAPQVVPWCVRGSGFAPQVVPAHLALPTDKETLPTF